MFAKLSKLSMSSRDSILKRCFTDKNNRKSIFFKGSNFEELLSGNYIFADKSLLIKSLLTMNFQIITRPRGWGKTLNLRMIESFFQPKVLSDGTFSQDLIKKEKFRQLKIGKETLTYNPIANVRGTTRIIDLQGTSPVVFLEFQDIRPKTKSDLKVQLTAMMQKTIKKHLYLFSSNYAIENLNSLKHYTKILPEDNDSFVHKVKNILEFLISSLHSYFGTRVILLVDGYDQMLMYLANQNSNFFQFSLDLFTDIFSIFKSGKDHSIQFSILSGVFKPRASGNLSIFNHFIYDSIGNPKNIELFGITDYELESIIRDCNRISKKELDVKNIKETIEKYYNGYSGYNGDNINETKLFNPTSVMECLNNLLSTNSDPYLNYWSRIDSTNLLENSLTESEDKTLIDNLMYSENLKFTPDDFLFISSNNEPSYKDNSYFKPIIFDREKSLLTYMVDAGYLTSYSKGSFYFSNLEVYETFYSKIAPVWMQIARPYFQNCAFTDAEIENINLFCESFQNQVLNQFEIKKPEILLKSLVYFSVFNKDKQIENYSPYIKFRFKETFINLMLIPIENKADSIYVIEFMKDESMSQENIIIEKIYETYASLALNFMNENAHIMKIIFRVVSFVPKEKTWYISANELIFDKKGFSLVMNDFDKIPKENLVGYFKKFSIKNSNN